MGGAGGLYNTGSLTNIGISETTAQCTYIIKFTPYFLKFIIPRSFSLVSFKVFALLSSKT